jgi:S1-C subfamily serine protease
MLLGKTEKPHQQNGFAVRRRARAATTAFVALICLPFLLYIPFAMGWLGGKPAFGDDLQEPVAKVMTPLGTGTAFLFSPTHLLTARHVVEGMNTGDKVDLLFEHTKNQRQVKGTIKYIAPSNTMGADSLGRVNLQYFLTDMAVLEVDEITDITPLTLGESDAVSNLDEVILIGYPGGDYSISKGNINNDKYQGTNLFKLDATSNPGNSGGPCILKEDNTVIGILVGSNSTQMEGENIAMKINDVKALLDQAGISY